MHPLTSLGSLRLVHDRYMHSGYYGPMVFHQRLFMKLQDPPPCALPLRGGVLPVQPTGSALIASSQEQSEWASMYLPPHTIDASAMVADAEDRLLAAVSSCSNHV